MKKVSAIALFVSAAISSAAFASDSHDRYVGSVDKLNDNFVVTDAKAVADILKYADVGVKLNLMKAYEDGNLTAAEIKASGIKDHHFYTGYLSSAKNQAEYDKKLKEMNGGANVDDMYVNNRDMKAHGSMLLNQVDGKLEVERGLVNGHLTKVGEGFKTVGDAVQTNIDNIAAIGEGSEQRVATVDGHFEQVGTALNTQAGHIAQVGTAVQGAHDKADANSAKVDKVIEGLKGLDGMEPGNPVQVEANRQNIAKIGEAVSDQYQAVSQNFLLHNGRITGLESTMEATTSSLNGLQATSNKLVVDMSDVRNQLATDNTRFEQVGKAVTNHQGYFSQVGTAVTNINGRLDKIVEGMKDLGGLVSGQVPVLNEGQKVFQLTDSEGKAIPGMVGYEYSVGKGGKVTGYDVIRDDFTFFDKDGNKVTLAGAGEKYDEMKAGLDEAMNGRPEGSPDGISRPVSGKMIVENSKNIEKVGQALETNINTVQGHLTQVGTALQNNQDNTNAVNAKLDKVIDGLKQLEATTPTLPDQGGQVAPDSKPVVDNSAQVEENKNNIASMGQAFEQRVDVVNDYLSQAGTAIGNNATAIKDLGNAFQAQAAMTASEIARLDGRIDSLEQKTDKMKAGIAGANAIASLTQYTGNGTHHVAVGIGGYDGAAAFAGGYTHALDANTTIRATISYDTEGEVGFGASFGHSW